MVSRIDISYLVTGEIQPSTKHFQVIHPNSEEMKLNTPNRIGGRESS
jgi:hypothetical protein